MLSIDHIKPLEGRIIIERPQVDASYGEQVVNGIAIPAIASRHRASYTLPATVVKVGVGVDPEIEVGGRVLVSEFAGTPIYDGQIELPYWMIGIGEILGIIIESPEPV